MNYLNSTASLVDRLYILILQIRKLRPRKVKQPIWGLSGNDGARMVQTRSFWLYKPGAIHCMLPPSVRGSQASTSKCFFFPDSSAPEICCGGRWPSHYAQRVRGVYQSKHSYCLKGPLHTPVHSGARSPEVRFIKEWPRGLFAFLLDVASTSNLGVGPCLRLWSVLWKNTGILLLSA